MFMLDYRRLSWWYWLLTVGVLTAGVLGYPAAFMLAIFLTVFQLVHFVIREGSITAFSIQVRLGYLLLLLIALPQSLQWIYWLPLLGTWAQVLLGTWAQVLFGYCLMARLVSLLPWNRTQHLSLALLRQTFFSAPVRGNILQGLPPA